MSSGTLRAIIYENNSLKILDQTLLPHETKYIRVENVETGWECIHSMRVRGAPAIALVGSLSLAVQLGNTDFESTRDLESFVTRQMDYLVSSRPTAVNLKRSSDYLKRLTRETIDSGLSVDEIKRTILERVEAMLDKDVKDNESIGSFGSREIVSKMKEKKKINVLTHCNTGSLATAGYGTALGVVRSLHEKKVLDTVYYCEARPYMQGSRLTSYELKHENIPSKLICDSGVSHLFKTTDIAAVVVGADRVASNGDTANKIGTYHIAVSANYHNVPFYVAAPFSSVDLSTRHGDDIVIEERDWTEMTRWKDLELTPEGTRCWNPAFDVTPARLITAIITEKGVFEPSDLAGHD